WPRTVRLGKRWSEWQDLNLRPPRPEKSALQRFSRKINESHRRSFAFVQFLFRGFSGISVGRLPSRTEGGPAALEAPPGPVTVRSRETTREPTVGPGRLSNAIDQRQLSRAGSRGKRVASSRCL